jgi:hypothetical protein
VLVKGDTQAAVCSRKPPFIFSEGEKLAENMQVQILFYLEQFKNKK